MNERIKKIFIHAGVRKTATSSLQESLFKSRKILVDIDDGYLYPQVSHFHHGRFILTKFTDEFINTRSFIRKFKGEKENMKSYAIREQIKFENEINRTNCKNIIISGEQISTLNQDEFNNLIEYLLKLAPNADICVVICTREHTSMYISGIQQSVKVGRRVDFSAENFIESKSYKKNLKAILSQFESENIISYEFEDIKNCKYGPIELFFKSINVKADYSNLINFKSNIGYSGFAVDILMYIDSSLPLITDNKLTKGRKFYDERMLGRLSGEKYLISKEMINELHEKCLPDKRWLKEKFGIDYINSYKQEYSDGVHFDSKYLREFKSIFIKLSPVIKKLCYDYIKEKQKLDPMDKKSKVVLSRLSRWINRIYPYIIKNDLDYFIKNINQKYKTKTLLQTRAILFFSFLYYKRCGFKKLFSVLKSKDGEELFR